MPEPIPELMESTRQLSQTETMTGANYPSPLSVSNSLESVQELERRLQHTVHRKRQLKKKLERSRQVNQQLRHDLQQVTQELAQAKHLIAALQVRPLWWLWKLTGIGIGGENSACHSTVQPNAAVQQEAPAVDHLNASVAPARTPATHASVTDKPSVAQLAFDEGQRLMAKGNVQGAIAQYQQALVLQPECAEFHFHLGHAFKRSGQMTQAGEQFDTAVRLRPDWLDARFAKATTVESAAQHNSKENLENFYGDRAIVEKYLAPDRLKFYDDITQFFAEKGVDYTHQTIADVGCGTGHLLLSLHHHFQPASLRGFEYSESAVEFAKTVLPEADFSYFDIYQPSPETFDVVFCTEVLEHLLHPTKALANLVGMLNPSGSLLLTVPNGRVDTFAGHVNFWSPESWNVFVSETCLDLERNLAVHIKVEAGLDSNHHNFAIIKRL